MKILPLSCVEYLRHSCTDDSRFPNPCDATDTQLELVPYIAESWGTRSGSVRYDDRTERIVVTFDEIRTMFDEWKVSGEMDEDYPHDITVHEWLRDCIDQGFHPCRIVSELTDVYCTYTGGGIYIITAKYGDVWLMSDIDSFGSYDVPYDDIEEKYDCDYDAHWKDSALPLPTWRVLLNAVRRSHKAGVSDNMDMYEVEEQFRQSHPDLDVRIDEEDPAIGSVPDADRRDTVIAIIEAVEDFLEERGIVIPNDEKSQSPDSASNIYGSDYGDLYDRIESILY